MKPESFFCSNITGRPTDNSRTEKWAFRSKQWKVNEKKELDATKFEDWYRTANAEKKAVF